MAKLKNKLNILTDQKQNYKAESVMSQKSTGL